RRPGPAGQRDRHRLGRRRPRRRRRGRFGDRPAPLRRPTRSPAGPGGRGCPCRTPPARPGRLPRAHTMRNATRRLPLSGLRPAALAALAVLLWPSPAAAADAPPALFASAFRGYWQGFLDFWSGGLQKQNGIVMFALAVGAVALFIITRGKWRK